jgi:hypothetical protein
MGTASKSFVLVLIGLFLTSLVILPSNSANAQSKTITVPDDFPTIQDAINNASAGDTIFVKKGAYYFNDPVRYGGDVDGVTIDKSITLIGEDSKTVTLEPHHTYKAPTLRSIIHVTADFVIISHITVKGEILISPPDNNTLYPYGCKIIGNILTEVEDHGRSTLIAGNHITGEVSLYSWDTIVSENNIEAFGLGLIVGFGENVTIKQNNFIGKQRDNRTNVPPYYGNLLLNNKGNGPVYVYQNNITANDFGVKFQETNNCFVFSNNIMDNRVGIYLPNEVVRPDGDFLGKGNGVYNNNFNNAQNVLVEQANRYLDGNETIGVITGNGTDAISWNIGLVGNYWSNYNGWGTYTIDGSNVDYFPLINSVDVSSGVPLLPLSTVLVTIIMIFTAIVIIAIALPIYFKKHKHNLVKEV